MNPSVCVEAVERLGMSHFKTCENVINNIVRCITYRSILERERQVTGHIHVTVRVVLCFSLTRPQFDT